MMDGDVEVSGPSLLMPRPSRASLLQQSFIRAASLTGAVHTPFELPLDDPYDAQHYQPRSAGFGEPVAEASRTWQDAAEETNK